MLRGVRYSDNYRKIDSIYLLDDPWRMSSPGEQHRFAETNRVIAERFGGASRRCLKSAAERGTKRFICSRFATAWSALM